MVESIGHKGAHASFLRSPLNEGGTKAKSQIPWLWLVIREQSLRLSVSIGRTVCVRAMSGWRERERGRKEVEEANRETNRNKKTKQRVEGREDGEEGEGPSASSLIFSARVPYSAQTHESNPVCGCLSESSSIPLVFLVPSRDSVHLLSSVPPSCLPRREETHEQTNYRSRWSRLVRPFFSRSLLLQLHPRSVSPWFSSSFH